jgi:hypothetical protein
MEHEYTISFLLDPAIGVYTELASSDHVHQCPQCWTVPDSPLVLTEEPVESTWSLWWTEWRWDRRFSEHFSLSAKYSLFFWFTDNVLCVSHLSVPNASLISSSMTWSLNNFRWRLKAMKVFMSQFSLASSYLVHFTFKFILLQRCTHTWHHLFRV